MRWPIKMDCLDPTTKKKRMVEMDILFEICFPIWIVLLCTSWTTMGQARNFVKPNSFFIFIYLLFFFFIYLYIYFLFYFFSLKTRDLKDDLYKSEYLTRSTILYNLGNPTLGRIQIRCSAVLCLTKKCSFQGYYYILKSNILISFFTLPS